MIRFHGVVCFLLFSSISNVIHADEMFIEDRKILALKACIYKNEKALGTYHENPNVLDYSLWSLSIGENEGYFSPEGMLALSDFVMKETEDFHKRRFSYHLEGYRGDFNHLFADCYRFHQSPELEEFLKNTPP